MLKWSEQSGRMSCLEDITVFATGRWRGKWIPLQLAIFKNDNSGIDSELCLQVLLSLTGMPENPSGSRRCPHDIDLNIILRSIEFELLLILITPSPPFQYLARTGRARDCTGSALLNLAVTAWSSLLRLGRASSNPWNNALSLVAASYLDLKTTLF